MGMKKKVYNGWTNSYHTKLPNITALDRRYTGGNYFKYSLEFLYQQGPLFCEIREWCWATYGPSRELKFIDAYDNKEYKWAWITDNHRTRIYLRDIEEVNWYKLRWI
jgi:hypothetical protein